MTTKPQTVPRVLPKPQTQPQKMPGFEPERFCPQQTEKIAP